MKMHTGMSHVIGAMTSIAIAMRMQPCAGAFAAYSSSVGTLLAVVSALLAAVASSCAFACFSHHARHPLFHSCD
jgi:predicted membrane channel-forming protein YqfA (hemolysin III family)